MVETYLIKAEHLTKTKKKKSQYPITNNPGKSLRCEMFDLIPSAFRFHTLLH